MNDYVSKPVTPQALAEALEKWLGLKRKEEALMIKLDLRKELKTFYAPSAKKVEVVEVPALQFAMIDGAIEPGSEPGLSPAFKEALQALYGVSYTLKFMVKQRKAEPVDYPVMGLEALWWIEDGEFSIERKDNWCWRALILQPDLITPALFEEAVVQVRKKRGDSPALGQLRLEHFAEGLCMQMLHVGPYATEPATVAKMDAFAAANGYRKRGVHHEIYLGDPMRAAPEKLKTILRHPIEAIGSHSIDHKPACRSWPPNSSSHASASAWWRASVCSHACRRH